MNATNFQQMETTARALVAPGKGILAADESLPTIEKRFKSINIPSTEENRREYRDMLFTTPSLGSYISGVILFDETLRQSSVDGRSFVEVLRSQHIMPGIKVDKGAKPLAGFPGEKITEGLDGLRDRLTEYRQLGAVFTKWRAVISISPATPTRTGLEANANALARFAALSQEAGLVPIVEPEVLMDGDHSIDSHFEATETVLGIVFQALNDYRVHLEGILIKPNMVLAGKDCSRKAGVSEAANMTLRCMLRTVSAAVPGIVFLSGGQTDTDATDHLRVLNQLGAVPWHLSFSFGRALQSAALKTWKGAIENVRSAQDAFLYRARCNSSACFGRFPEEMEHLFLRRVAA
jgi:fructose-bisphosphate aldolase class I